ncbi:MAG TPA: hypothetical protein VHM30_08960, partial [Gemmatimonadaceae bacterium]|nr:hypothetical protein [Gemmatimonadaceae bacterium]
SGTTTTAPTPDDGSLFCVVPIPGISTVDVGEISADSTEWQAMEVTGVERTVDIDGCKGWELAQWSPDGRRIYRRAEHTCPGNVVRRSSGLLALSALGELVDVETVIVGSDTAVRAARYRATGMPESLARRFPTVRSEESFATRTARTAAGASATTEDIIEVVKEVGAPATEAWLRERQQRFSVDAKQLVALADAGVPGRVIDVLVALSYPETFAVDGRLREPERYATRAPRARRPWYGPTRCRYGYDSFDVASYVMVPGGFVPAFYMPSSLYSPYGYRCGYGGGFYGGPWYGGGTVIRVRDVETGRGKAVKGRGYTRGDGSGGSGTGASTSVRDTPRNSGTKSGSSGSKPTRTAKPRNKP